jgi:hypothetical protein
MKLQFLKLTINPKYWMVKKCVRHFLQNNIAIYGWNEILLHKVFNSCTSMFKFTIQLFNATYSTKHTLQYDSVS